MLAEAFKGKGSDFAVFNFLPKIEIKPPSLIFDKKDHDRGPLASTWLPCFARLLCGLQCSACTCADLVHSKMSYRIGTAEDHTAYSRKRKILLNCLILIQAHFPLLGPLRLSGSYHLKSLYLGERLRASTRLLSYSQNHTLR